MQARNTSESWGWVSRLLHWGMAGLIVYQLGLGVYAANFVSDLFAQFRLTQLHKSWGTVIFVLALVRIGWRLANRAHPGMPPGTPRWQVRAAAASHGLLYALMLILPLSGWVMSAASPVQDALGMQNLVFGRIPLPDPWVPGVASVEAAAKVVHLGAAILLTLILVLHVAAAVRHLAIDRDGVFDRMTLGR